MSLSVPSGRPDAFDQGHPDQVSKSNLVPVWRAALGTLYLAAWCPPHHTRLFVCRLVGPGLRSLSNGYQSPPTAYYHQALSGEQESQRKNGIKYGGELDMYFSAFPYSLLQGGKISRSNPSLMFVSHTSIHPRIMYVYLRGVKLGVMLFPKSIIHIPSLC